MKLFNLLHTGNRSKILIDFPYSVAITADAQRYVLDVRIVVFIEK